MLAAIEAGELDALSLDFFDTTSGRAVPRPVVAFRRVGERLAARGLLPVGFDPSAFVPLRIGAEERSRRRQPGRTEVHLADIYDELPASLLAPERRAAAAAAELDVECELAIVDPAVIAVAERARARGLRVAVVSDTYFTAAQLLEILRRAGCDFAPDIVLTSGDLGVCKAAGLHRELVAKLALEPRRIGHLGDDAAADGVAAAAAGLRPLAYLTGDDELRAAMAREAALTLENAGEDGGLSFLRRRAVSRSAAAGAARAGHFRVGATVFGPVFTGYAEWVVDRFSELGLAGGVAFMREGDFLAELVSAAAAARGEELAIAPLWISRAAAFRASIGEVDAAVLRGALVRRAPPRVDEFCCGFGISPASALLPRSSWAADMSSPAVQRRVFAALLAPDVRTRIEQGAAAQRALLLELIRDLAPPQGALACVDVGWGATIQKLLVAALRRAGVEREVLGLYLSASSRAAGAMLEGSIVRGYLASPGDHDAFAELVARSPEMIEQLCTSHVGSVLEYERDSSGGVVPVLGAVPADPQGARERAAVRDGIRFFQAEYLALRRRTHSALPSGEVRRILARFLARPLESEAALVGGWWHDENFGSGAALAIAPRVPAAALVRRSAAELYWDRSVPWPAGVAAQGHPALADELGSYALIGAFGPGESPVHQADRVPARYLLADELDSVVRTVAPRLYQTCAWAASQWSPGADPVPLRHRIADALNEKLKNIAPSLHARAKAAAADAIGSRGAILWPAARRAGWLGEQPRAPRRPRTRRAGQRGPRRPRPRS